jgi:hypothetical protein
VIPKREAGNALPYLKSVSDYGQYKRPISPYKNRSGSDRGNDGKLCKCHCLGKPPLIS